MTVPPQAALRKRAHASSVPTPSFPACAGTGYSHPSKRCWSFRDCPSADAGGRLPRSRTMPGRNCLRYTAAPWSRNKAGKAFLFRIQKRKKEAAGPIKEARPPFARPISFLRAKERKKPKESFFCEHIIAKLGFQVSFHTTVSSCAYHSQSSLLKLSPHCRSFVRKISRICHEIVTFQQFMIMLIYSQQKEWWPPKTGCKIKRKKE